METLRKSKHVLRQVGRTCTYCMREMNLGSDSGLHPTRDHIVPRSMGGTVTVWCCADCNNIKGCMTPEQWKNFRARNPTWWLKRTRASRRLTFAQRLNRIPKPAMTAAETSEFLRMEADKAARKAAGRPLKGSDRKALLRRIENNAPSASAADLATRLAHADPETPSSPFEAMAVRLSGDFVASVE